MACVGKYKPNWRLPVCGGPEVHGTEDCVIDDMTGIFDCKCIPRPKQYNYDLHYRLAQSIFDAKLYSDVNCSKWDEHCLQLFTVGSFSCYQQCQGNTLKSRFFPTMIEEVSKRHGVGKFATGFESHPDITAYDELMLKMIKEIEKAEAQKQAAKDKQAANNSSMLAHESNMRPVINMTKRTNTVMNEEGEDTYRAAAFHPV
mmetsp:Transcript_33207/g.65930  ORF Transcript_33207/g.65930 Transcript_33207/m.65930 type:complete len:201 (+) Transcript_33207:939-1541(+)